MKQEGTYKQPVVAAGRVRCQQGSSKKGVCRTGRPH